MLTKAEGWLRIAEINPPELPTSSTAAVSGLSHVLQ